MTVRNLDALFAPRAVALVGASNQPHSVGAVLAANLLSGGFAGPVLPVNPRAEAIRSTLNYRSVAELPHDVDLAVIATPPPTVPGLIAELGGRGCRAAVVITAGFGEGREAGKALQQQMLAAARPHLLRILGPNCLGFISPGIGLNASFAHLTPAEGGIAFLSQSGAVATAVLDWAAGRSIGFSHIASLGDMADIDFGDLLDYLALDARTKAILLYVEAVSDARKFMSAGRIAARLKPVVVMKSGRSQSGAKAALSHTGALAGADAVYDAAFRRAGMLRVTELRELFSAVTTIASGLQIESDRLAIVTNGGGLGVIAADALEARGGTLASLSASTIERLNQVLPHAWSRGNPVDILGDAPGSRYAAAIAAVLEDPGRDAVLVINCPVAVADSLDAAKSTAEAGAARPGAPLLTCWAGDASAESSRRLFAARAIPSYGTPGEAVQAFMHIVDYRRNQAALMETPPAHPDTSAEQRARAGEVIEAVLAAGRELLTEPEAKAVLAAYGIPTVRTLTVRSAAEVESAAEGLGRAVAVKILSPDITHKSDVGGVRLGLASPRAARRAAEEMLETVAERAPGATIAGFTVQEMIVRPKAMELIAGISEDPTFGPTVLFGHGGVAAEVIADRSIGLPPLNLPLARRMIAATRVARLLAGYRDVPPADLDAIALVLVRLSEMIVDHADIAELDINPLLADSQGVIALDARVAVRPASAGRRLAIQPYPSALERMVSTAAGALLIRPVRPQDEPALIAMVARSTEDDRRLRFQAAVRGIPHLSAARMTQIDYDREMNLVAIDPVSQDVLGIAQLAADPDRVRAEFGVMVRSDLKGRGIGYALMTELLDHARRMGVVSVFGQVVRGNATMLQMAREFGFRVEDGGGDSVQVTARLDPATTMTE